jgi:hypothetical protein
MDCVFSALAESINASVMEVVLILIVSPDFPVTMFEKTAFWEGEKIANRPADTIATIINDDQIRLSVIVIFYENNVRN